MLENLSGDVVLIGDFNLLGIVWDRLYCDRPKERVVLEVMQRML